MLHSSPLTRHGLPIANSASLRTGQGPKIVQTALPTSQSGSRQEEYFPSVGPVVDTVP